MRSLFSKSGWIVAGVLAFALVASLARGALGGPLDPTDPPGPTGKTLEQIPGAWGRQLDSTNGRDPLNPGCFSDRFECVFPRGVGCNPFCVATVYDGVHDRETGLVWEKEPSAAAGLWLDAINACRFVAKGERYGWRLPTYDEQRTLLDGSADHLPDGSPFEEVFAAPAYFWTATTYQQTDAAGVAYTVQIDQPGLLATENKDGNVDARHWCVRAAGGVDGGHSTDPTP